MILRVEELKEACTKILNALDPNALSTLTETLEIKAKGNNVYVGVTNKEYFVEVKIPTIEEIDFMATVNANLFLRLVVQTTSETIELNIDGSNLIFQGNGTYKIPLIFEEDKLLELPRITIDNVTCEFDIDSAILNSIFNYNTKQITVGTATRPVQKLYYVDEKGCITFTCGACVNSFELEKPVRMLLNQRLVKLFKLFKSGKVQFKLGYDSISPEVVQTKISLVNDNTEITAILNGDDKMIASVPVDAIRSRASDNYDYSITIDRKEIMECIDRIKLFTSANNSLTSYAKFEFQKDCLIISDTAQQNKETIFYKNDLPNLEENYITNFDLNEFSAVLDTCIESYLILRFGNHQAISICRGQVINIIPEVVIE